MPAIASDAPIIVERAHEGGPPARNRVQSTKPRTGKAASAPHLNAAQHRRHERLRRQHGLPAAQGPRPDRAPRAPRLGLPCERLSSASCEGRRPLGPHRHGVAPRHGLPRQLLGSRRVRAAAGPLRLRAGLVGRRLLLPFGARLPRAAERLHAQRLGAAQVRAPDHEHQAPAAQPHARAGRVPARLWRPRRLRGRLLPLPRAILARWVAATRRGAARAPASTCTSCRRG